MSTVARSAAADPLMDDASLRCDFPESSDRKLLLVTLHAVRYILNTQFGSRLTQSVSLLQCPVSY